MAPRLLYCTMLAGLLALSPAQAQTKADKKVIKQLKADIGYLASDELGGRLTGSEGERKAGDYIIARYEQLNIRPYNGRFRHPFQFVHGKEVLPATEIRLGNDMPALTHKDAFPFAFSASKTMRSEVIPDAAEIDGIWLLPLYENKDEADDAHFDWEKKAFDAARKAAKEGAKAVLLYDAYGARYPPEFNKHSEYETINIPAVFIGHKAWETQISGKAYFDVQLDVQLKKTERTGHNIAAFMDNKAKYTVVLGAHYDHLGLGEDGSSLYAGKEKQIHNGADDNASGTAALLQLAQWVKKNKLKHYNYLFAHFSGEELGLFGSKAMTKEADIDSLHIAYMLNMDMIGRLNDSSRALTLGGIGTSPMWSDIVAMGNKSFKVNLDSAGVGPSDHASFYGKGIPVLFFFTGSHHDYHKPTDDADKINYTGEAEVITLIESVVERLEGAPKPPFTPTRQNTAGKVRFKVTLGIMPDYSYNDGGVRADGVAPGKPADKAGLVAGDVIIAIGKDKVEGMQSYMEALARQKEGAKTTVTIKRKGKELQLPITFQ